ncbi:hypothetical protein V6N13_048488 [Hibiscus sabdariffa]
MWVALVRVRFSPALWFLRWPANLFLAGSLFVAVCGARPSPVLEIALRFVQPSIACVLPCSWHRKLVHLSVPMRPPCLRLHPTVQPFVAAIVKASMGLHAPCRVPSVGRCASCATTACSCVNARDTDYCCASTRPPQVPGLMKALMPFLHALGCMSA